MLTPEYLAECSDELILVFEGLQTDLLKALVKRILKMGYASETSVYQMELLQEAGMLFSEAVEIISRRTGLSEKALIELFEDAGAHTIAYEDKLYALIGKKGLPLHLSPSLMQILEAGYLKMQGILNNMTMTTAITTQESFISTCNEVYYKVASGAFSYNQAIREAVTGLSAAGTEFIYYPSGHRDRVDVAVRRAALTGVNQTAAALQIARAQEMDEDLVETSAHAGARPSHDEWQGQVFSISGQHPKYSSLEEGTGYGTGEGLCGWNCRHSFHTYFDGISTPAYSPEDLGQMNARDIEYDGETYTQYEISQMQRGQEREIRAAKRTLAGLNAAATSTGDAALAKALRADFDALAILMKEKETNLTSFINITGQQRQKEREQVFGFGRSESMKAVWAKRKAESK